MGDEGGVTWSRLVMIIFTVIAIIVLLLLVTAVFLLPILTS